MPATYHEATDQIYLVLTTIVTSGATAILGYVPVIYWPGDKPPETAEGNVFWIRVSRQNITEDQATLSSDVAQVGVGKQRFETLGILVVQIFCPQSTLNAYDLGSQMAVLIRNAYRKATTEGGCWFTNCRVRELPPEDVFHRFNVLVNYRYDDII